MYVSRATFRLGFAPPETTADVLKRCPLGFKGSAAVMPRLGVLEDFESQPQPLTSPVRRLRMDGLKLTTEKAHSGKYAVVLKGTPNRDSRGLVSIAPQIPLDADATYRIEAWVLVEQAETEASITADLCAANVHHKDRLRRQQTGIAAGPCDWQKIELEFSTRGLGLDPFLDFRFRVVGPGKAFLDDLHFRKIAPGEARRE